MPIALVVALTLTLIRALTLALALVLGLTLVLAPATALATATTFALPLAITLTPLSHTRPHPDQVVAPVVAQPAVAVGQPARPPPKPDDCCGCC